MTGPTLAQHRRMHALWKVAGVTDRADRLALTAAYLGRPVTSSNDLTEDTADALIGYMARLDRAGCLELCARGWLARRREPVS